MQAISYSSDLHHLIRKLKSFQTKQNVSPYISNSNLSIMEKHIVQDVISNPSKLEMKPMMTWGI